MTEYYKDKAATDKAITKDGWFRTGDVGQWNEDGTLSVVDRIKNLVKLSGGEVSGKGGRFPFEPFSHFRLFHSHTVYRVGTT